MTCWVISLPIFSTIALLFDVHSVRRYWDYKSHCMVSGVQVLMLDTGFKWVGGCKRIEMPARVSAEGAARSIRARRKAHTTDIEARGRWTLSISMT
jgi:hypothetical protein